MGASESTILHYTEADPDVRLMLKVRDDNAQAFQELVERYQTRLVSLLAFQLGSRDMAEDLAQEVFLRVYRARKRYEPGAKFSTWLFTIANNVALNARRTLARRKEVSVSPSSPDRTGMQPIQPAAASGAMPTRQADKAELQDIVRLAVDQLSERQRMAVMLAKFEHLGYAEIGEVMGLQPSAVKSLLARSREKLRVLLRGYLERGDAIGSLIDSEEEGEPT